jgi:glycine cleavage system H protein
MPLTGEVLEVNAGLDAAPENVNNDADGEGWMIKATIANKDEVATLMSAADYKGLVH